jgi:BolA protein
MLVEIIKSKLSENLNIDSLDIIDESHKHANHAQSSGGHFRVRIVSEDFQDKSLIERHRMVYGILGDMLKNEIHALSIDARALNE